LCLEQNTSPLNPVSVFTKRLQNPFWESYAQRGCTATVQSGEEHWMHTPGIEERACPQQSLMQVSLKRSPSTSEISYSCWFLLRHTVFTPGVSFAHKTCTHFSFSTSGQSAPPAVKQSSHTAMVSLPSLILQGAQNLNINYILW
jgi:hypothetical protein